jgi:hypothetical protein
MQQSALETAHSGMGHWLSTEVLLKGLKDKGDVRPSVALLIQQLAVIQDDMHVARMTTRSVPSHVFFLEIYRRGSSRHITLRWRMTNTKHTTWPMILPVVRTLPAAMRDWYEAMNEHATLLNLKSNILVHNIRMLEQFQQPGGPERGTAKRGAARHHDIRQKMLALNLAEAPTGEIAITHAKQGRAPRRAG